MYSKNTILSKKFLKFGKKQAYVSETSPTVD